MFHPKPAELPPKLPKKTSRSRPNTTPNQRLVTFYCEVNPPKSAPKRPDMPRSLNHTLIELGDIEGYAQRYSQKNPYGGKLMVDKEMGIDMNFSQESIEEDLHKISEVHSSMEFSVSEADQRAKSFSYIKKKKTSSDISK